MKRLLRILGLILLVLLLLNAAVIAYFITSRGPKERAQTALQTTGQVEVTSGEWQIFAPRNTTPTTGLIFYPGTFVNPKAYAEPAYTMAAAGYLVVVVPMPLGMAFLAPNRAATVQAAFPDIEKWVIGGHSQGGSYAIRYAFANPDEVDGLILWAGRPLGNDDLSGRNLPVLSINGSLDPRRSPEILAEIEARLPADAKHINIDGGTHEYFGDYAGELDEEVIEKAITQDKQTEIIIEESVDFLATVSAMSDGR